MKPFLLSVLAIVSVALPARGEFPTSQPFRGVRYEHEKRGGPDESVYVITVDIADPHVKVRVATAGADPDGAEEWQTTLMSVKKIAEREHFDVAINASFFKISRPTSQPIAEEVAEKQGQPVTTKPAVPGYAAGAWAKSAGWTMSDGKVISGIAWANSPSICMEGDGKMELGEFAALPRGAMQMATGSDFLVRDGKAADPFRGMMKVRHPRTVVGLDREGKALTIAVIDGRRPGVSAGMTGAELAEELIRHGCWNAINLDGGGSSTLVMRDVEAGKYVTLNQPSDSHDRAVSDALGVTIQP